MVPSCGTILFLIGMNWLLKTVSENVLAWVVCNFIRRMENARTGVLKIKIQVWVSIYLENFVKVEVSYVLWCKPFFLSLTVAYGIWSGAIMRNRWHSL